MKKKKTRTKTPEYRVLVKEFLAAESSSEYFWKYSDSQIEKIGRKINAVFEDRLDEWGYEEKWWTSPHVQNVEYRANLKAIQGAFEIHTMQRIFMGEEHVEKWEEEPGPKGKFEWQKPDTDSET